MAGPSKKDTEQAHRSGRFDLGADEGPSDSGSSSEKKHQEELRRAAAWLWRQVQATERTRLRSRGLTTNGEVRGDFKLRELMQAKE